MLKHIKTFNTFLSPHQEHARIQGFSSGGVQVSMTKKSSDNEFILFF